MISMLLNSTLLGGLLIALAFASTHAFARSIKIETTGPTETVFSWASDKCSVDQIPDSPARAFRSDDGLVRVMAAHYTNQFLVGKSLETISGTCRISYSGKMNSDPEAFDARIWLQTFFTEDGKTIYALGSSDYHGNWFGRCTASNSENSGCWRSAITLAISSDSGNTFQSLPAPNHVIARPPFRFQDDEPGRPPGFFTTSNIVKRGNAYFSLIYTFGFSNQKAGNCLMRTHQLESAGSWRAWDGENYTISLPNTESAGDLRTTVRECVIVRGLTEPVRSLLWHQQSNQFIATFAVRHRVDSAAGKVVRTEFRFTTSIDLITWTPSQLVHSDTFPKPCPPSSVATVGYPALLDPMSNDRNFGTLGESGYLYFTRYNKGKDCQMNLDRDLVRIPIKVTG